jgi:anti-repressor protein
LEVGRDFSNWIKGRIAKFGFEEGIDYITSESLSSPNLANPRSRVQVTKEYYISINIAQELSMVENNRIIVPTGYGG